MIRMFSGARWRMVGWSILVLALILVAIGGVLYASLTRTLMSTLDGQLESASQAAQRELLEAGGIGDFGREGYQAGVLYVLVAPDGSVLSNPQQVDVQALPPGVFSSSSLFQTVNLGGEPVRLYATRVVEPTGDTITVLVGQSLAPEAAAAERIMLTLLVCGAIGLVLSFAGAWFLAARALVPIQQAFQRQQEFVADASHELRTPLTILHSAADLLATDSGTPNPELVHEIRDEIHRMERLTRDLLTLARSDRGELRLSLGHLDLNAFAHEIVGRVGVLAQVKGIHLAVVDAGEPVVVEGDPDRLQQVGLILLDNALEHTPPGGMITVTVEACGTEAMFEVQDTGEGIPDEHLTRVFDRFHRADPSRARDTGGTGLGLAIAQTLVTAHGGTIGIARRDGGGTRVRVRLPLAAPEDDEFVDEHASSGLADR